MNRVTHLSLSRSLVITFVLVLYQDTGQGVTFTSCGFEDGNICGYSQFNWMRRSGDTADTGPSAAYEGSYYLYIEANRYNVGDRAVLQTPDVSCTGAVCVSLAYHMYGEDIGNLTLSVSNSRGMWDLLHKTGNQGNTWMRFQDILLCSSRRNRSFVIEGIRGSGDKGGIAIDDFSVVTGTCKTSVSLPYFCSFENDICDMWQPSSEDIRWLRTHKDNPAPETGSSGDSGGSWFLSLASDRQGNWGIAYIDTPALNFTGDICVKFKYYLSSNVSTVDVHQANEITYPFRTLFADKGPTGPKGRSVSLTVRSFVRNHSILFYGRILGGQAESIVLDEIYISRNICDGCAVNNGGCSCTNTDTGPMCSCRMGYVKFEETGCQDLDECLAGTDGCSHECQNEDGTYSCHCPGGWSLSGNRHTCQDIDECATATDNECDHVCINVRGSYKCSCRAPYILATDGRHCIDCAVNNGGCSQTCRNTYRGPMCSCRMGYVKFEETGCQDIDECSAGTDACSHDCQNEDGTYSCHCPGGWSLTGDGYNCQDVDECATATDNECDHVCINVEGSYNCSCRATYILATDGRHCIDCAVNNGGCSQTCRNTYRGPMCSCRMGYVKFEETGCQDIDECLAGTDGCSHECQNEDGTYSCHCPGGWSLTGDRHTCQYIDECAAATDNECDHVCINVEGSYNCSCRATYILATDGRHCIECGSAYERRVAASQLLTSDCPTTSSHTEITLDDCFLEACSRQTGVIAYFNMVCNLKFCDRDNLRLKNVSGSTGWHIYVLNTTRPMLIMGGDPDEPREGDGFPLAVVAGVVVPVILLVVIVIAVVFIVRRRGSREEDQSAQCVHYARQPVSVGEVRTPPINENQAEVGIDDEVMETPERQAAVANTYII